MKLIKPKYEIWEQGVGLEDIYKHIERAGRICYKSEQYITEGSAKPFVDRMIKSGHHAVLEHGTVYLILFLGNEHKKVIAESYEQCPYSWVVYDGDNHAYVTTNYRVLVGNGWLDDLQYLSEPTKYHKKRITVHFTCDRGVSHEFVRHRLMSFCQESTRYCNYSKDKFGSSITCITPPWLTDNEKEEFESDLIALEAIYFKWLNKGWQPQQARFILPNALKTELVMTGFEEEWEHFFRLRAEGVTGKPHPQAEELAIPLMREFRGME